MRNHNLSTGWLLHFHSICKIGIVGKSNTVERRPNDSQTEATGRRPNSGFAGAASEWGRRGLEVGRFWFLKNRNSDFDFLANLAHFGGIGTGFKGIIKGIKKKSFSDYQFLISWTGRRNRHSRLLILRNRPPLGGPGLQVEWSQRQGGTLSIVRSFALLVVFAYWRGIFACFFTQEKHVTFSASLPCWGTLIQRKTLTALSFEVSMLSQQPQGVIHIWRPRCVNWARLQAEEDKKAIRRITGKGRREEKRVQDWFIANMPKGQRCWRTFTHNFWSYTYIIWVRGHPYMTSALRGEGGLAQKKM